MQIAAKENVKTALWFALGVVFVEMVYLRITLSLIDLFWKYNHLFLKLQWITVALLLLLAAGSFWALRKPDSAEAKNILIENRVNRFVLGFFMSFVNLVQLPFWAGWVSYLFAQQWIANNNLNFNLFTVAAGVGTFMAMMLFMLAGRKFSTVMKNRQHLVHWAMGTLFLVMATFQAWQILKQFAFQKT